MRQKVLLYIFFIAIVIELFFRVCLCMLTGTSFFRPGDVIYHYYPVVREIEKTYGQKDPQTYKILILSCSTMHREWGGFKNILERKLAEQDTAGANNGPRSYTVFNAAGIGFSSQDNLNCYRLLSKLKFDLVLCYTGINDVRFNNCPKGVFRDDYSHNPWNNEINCILRHPEMNFIVTPFFIDYIYQLLSESLFKDHFMPIHYSMRPGWWDYGPYLKSLPSIRSNIQAISNLSKEKNEKLLLAPYCYYIPADYSLERFRNKSLDYAFQPNSRETEIWGHPANVASFLDSANIIIREIAIANNDHYIDLKPEIMHHNKYFADVCHFSPEGLNTIAGLVSEQIKVMARQH